MQLNGTLFIISAPSGGGKTSLVNTLVSQMPKLKVSVSYTTRSPRGGEVDKQNYFFVNEATFLELQEQGKFLESAKVFNYWYGTSKEWVMNMLSLGIDVILEIDWQGAKTVREKIQSTSIFILPPSKDILLQRLQSRKQDSPEIIATRMQESTKEISHYGEYDYVIINDNFDEALLDLKCIVRANRVTVSRQKQRHASLLAQLME